MPESIVLNPELSVFGPAASIDVRLDIGPTGTRGSKQFVGTGDPGPTTVPETPLLNDLYLNISNSALHQYLNDAGVNKWIQVGKFAPLTYNTVATKTFTSGSASFTFDINSMFGINTTTKDFVITHNIIGTSNTISSVITQPTLTTTVLSFDIKAKSFNGTSWEDLTGSQKVMLSISISA